MYGVLLRRKLGVLSFHLIHRGWDKHREGFVRGSPCSDELLLRRGSEEPWWVEAERACEVGRLGVWMES